MDDADEDLAADYAALGDEAVLIVNGANSIRIMVRYKGLVGV